MTHVDRGSMHRDARHTLSTTNITYRPSSPTSHPTPSVKSIFQIDDSTNGLSTALSDMPWNIVRYLTCPPTIVRPPTPVHAGQSADVDHCCYLRRGMNRPRYRSSTMVSQSWGAPCVLITAEWSRRHETGRRMYGCCTGCTGQVFMITSS